MAVGVPFLLFGYKAKARPAIRIRVRGFAERIRKDEARIRAAMRTTAEMNTT